MKYILVFWNKCSKRSVQKLQTIFIANYLGYFSKRLNFLSRRMKKKILRPILNELTNLITNTLKFEPKEKRHMDHR